MSQSAQVAGTLAGVQWGSFAQYLAAFGSISASIVALWGVQLRQYMFPPKLVLSLLDPEGVDTVDKNPENPVVRRWYHLKVVNPRRFLPVHNVRVYALKFELLGAVNCIVWEGMIPLTWRHEAKFEAGTSRDLGYGAEVDLFSIRSGVDLKICTSFDSHGVGRPLKAPVHMRVTVQARGLEADSNVITVEIGWEGGWPEDRTLMPKHVRCVLI